MEHRIDWDNLEAYHHSGLWDLTENKDRIPNLLYVEAILDGFGILEKHMKLVSETISNTKSR